VRVAIDGRVIADHFPGIGRYVYHLADALPAVAPDDTFVLLHTPGQTNTRHDLEALARHANLALSPVGAPVFGLAAQWRIPRALAVVRADAFHATYWVTAYRPGVPTVLTLYDLIGRQVPGSVPSLKRWALDLAVRLSSRAADHVLTLSEASKRDLVAAAGLPAGRVTVTPLAVDARFRPVGLGRVADLRARLGLPARYVLYVGINKPHKNLGTLVDAWGRLVTEWPEAVAGAALAIAGPWDARYASLRDRAAALPVGAAVRFLGPVAEADLPALYSGAALFAFPSRHEGFGLPPLEAMACGAPVVAADASSLPEVVGDAGRLVDPDDVAGWAAALAEVLTRPDLAADMRARGPARAARFTWAETARRTLAVYRAVAERGLVPGSSH